MNSSSSWASAPLVHVHTHRCHHQHTAPSRSHGVSFRKLLLNRHKCKQSSCISFLLLLFYRIQLIQNPRSFTSCCLFSHQLVSTFHSTSVHFYSNSESSSEPERRREKNSVFRVIAQINIVTNLRFLFKLIHALFMRHQIKTHIFRRWICFYWFNSPVCFVCCSFFSLRSLLRFGTNSIFFLFYYFVSVFVQKVKSILW